MGEIVESTPQPVAKWEGRRAAEENMCEMTQMGLHVFNPAWQQMMGSAQIGAKYSGTFTKTTVTIFGTDKELTFPVQTCTRVKDVRQAIAGTCMVSEDVLTFVVKQGCAYRKQLDQEEIGRKVYVKGISSFKPNAHKYPHPTGIIGAGYNGIKTSICYLKEGIENIVCFDRNDKVGGYCWITAANKTSKLQTEFGSFHVWWGPEFARSKRCGGWPTPDRWYAWPGKLKILEHFNLAAEDYGMIPHVKFKTNVVELDIVGPKDDINRYYNLTYKSLEKEDAEPETMPVSVMYNYPGSMTKNRIIEYPGEDTFEGHIGYGMNDDMPYDKLADTNVAILGNGAFAVENIRTACELGSIKVFLVTRRKNLASPRVPCWFVHQGPIPTPGRIVLDMFKPMYDLAGFGDPWDYWSVHAPADKSRATVIQNSRFGIGDVTFICQIYGKLEYVESTVKRVTKHTLHLNNGDKLQDVTCIVKSLGLLGDFEVDRLHKMKEIIGNWCGGDYRRVIQIDPLGMNAANFTTFSTGIGSYGGVWQNKYLHDFPQEYNNMVGNGLLQQLPRQKADEKLEKPAYVTDVKFQMAAGIIIGGMCPKLAERDNECSPYKHEMYHRAHPWEKFLELCIEDWDKYQTLFKKQGCTHEYVPYPYNREMVSKYFEEYSKATGYPIVIDGPKKTEEATKENLTFAELMESRKNSSDGTDEGTRGMITGLVNSDHMGWWMQEGPKGESAMFQKNVMRGDFGSSDLSMR